MKANELRIGNWVELEGVISMLNKTTFKSIIDGRYESLKPIPLTEEILLKCGFVKCKDVRYDSMYTYKGMYIDLDQNYTNVYVDWCENEHEDSIVCWESYGLLHQLQNLYYALTQQELQVNL